MSVKGINVGNVRVTFSDIKMPTGTTNPVFDVDLLSTNHYYPYGMKINDLSYNATGARYGYNGKEQDNEVKGDNNSIDFGARIYDPRVAMRRNQEPLRAKYPNLSGYSAFGNNPIQFSDLDGNDRIVAFSGANILSTNETATAGEIIKTVNNYVLKNKIENVQTLAIATGLFESQVKNNVNEAFNFITKDLKSDEKVIVYGYSLGGVGAQDLTRKLNSEGISVDLLVLVDVAAGWDSSPLTLPFFKNYDNDVINRTIPNNVQKIFNFYQTNEEGISGSHGGPSTGTICNSPLQLIYNHDLTNQIKDINHKEIDGKTKEASEALIINEIIEEE